MEISKVDSYKLPGEKEISNLEVSKSVKKVNKSIGNIEDKQSKIDPKELNSAVAKANKVLFKNNTHLQFRIHEKTKDVMVKIINDESGEVLKEIPPEKMLDMIAKLWEIAGILVDEKR